MGKGESGKNIKAEKNLSERSIKDVKTQSPKIIPNLRTFERAVLESDIASLVKIIETLVRSWGWNSVLSDLLQHLDRFIGPAWFARNWYLLSVLDVVELVGIDFDVEELLKDIDDHHNFSDVRRDANKKLIEIVRKQLREGYPTYFYNLELMKQKKTIVIIEDLIRARQKELIHSINRVSNGIYSLSESYYGLAQCIEKGILDSSEDGDGGWIRIDIEYVIAILEQLAKDSDTVEIKSSAKSILKQIAYDKEISGINYVLHPKEDSRFQGIFDSFHYILEMYWRREPGGGVESFNPVVRSGIADSISIVQMTDNFKGLEGWRGIPDGLLPIFTNFNKFSLIPTCMVYLIEMHHPIVPLILEDVLLILSYRSHNNEYFEGDIGEIIEAMTDDQIEENIKSLVNYIGKSEMDLSDEGWGFPQGIIAASKALEKKAHLLTSSDRREIASIYNWLPRQYQDASHICYMNEVMLRTRGAESIEFAKDKVLSYFTREDNLYFIDYTLADFLESKNVDLTEVLASKLIGMVYEELYFLDALDTAINYNSGVIGVLRSKIRDQTVTEREQFIFALENSDSLEEFSERTGISLTTDTKN